MTSYKILLLFLVVILTSVNVRAQEITMFPGSIGVKYYQDDVKLTKNEISQLMAEDLSTNQLWQKSKSLETLGWISSVASLLIIGYGAKSGSSNALLYTSLGLALVGSGFLISTHNLKRKAILKYNNSLEDGIAISISPYINGIRLTMHF